VTPVATTTYTLTAQGLGGPVTRMVTVTVVPAPTIATFTASPAAITTGGSTQLTATFAGGTATIDHGLGSVTTGIPAGTGALAASTTYLLTVTNAAGDSVTASTTVTVGTAVAITGFSAGSGTITAGASTTLLPSFVNATGASVDTGIGAVASGSAVTVAPAATTTYTLTAQGLNGPVTRTLTVTVVPAPGIATFTATPATLATGASAQLTATFITVVPAPVINSFTAAPTSLAAGQSTTFSWAATGATAYSINNGVGTVTGPSAIFVPPTGTTTYRLTASSTYGSASAQVTVTSGPPVALSYSTNPATYTRNTAITPNMPSNGGGPITTYTVAPSLPAGLLLNAGTGVITGTPTATTASATYVMRGTNSYDFTQYNLVLAVNEMPPAVTYAGGPFTWNTGVPVTLSATSTGGPVTSWAIAPTQPSGLTFNTANGQITGTPTALTATQTYTVTATNSGGTSTPAFSLTVTQTPPAIAYGSPSYACYVGVPLTPLVPTNTGGLVVTWAINPALPAGLVFDTTTGHISGTPTTVASALAYTITATNPGGTSQASPTFSVAVHGPVLAVQPHGLILTPGDVPLVSVTASGTGALSYQWCRNGSPSPWW
jgi:hypothetical protein